MCGGAAAVSHASVQALQLHTLPALRTQNAKFKLRRRRDPAVEPPPPTVHDFVALRLDRAYAASARVLHEACARDPDYSPRSALDFGLPLLPISFTK